MSTEKDVAHVMVDSQSSEEEHLEVVQHSWKEIEASGNWYDRRFISWLPPFSHSTVQIVLMSFVIFLTPGCFNAITGIGNSGIADPKVADNANVALYSTFATVGALGGVICNIIGVRACLVFGGSGYVMYTLSLLVYHYKGNAGFCIFAGAYLGVCASLTWAAQGSIIMSYALESSKAHAIMIFWVIFNFGAVLGSIIPLVQNLEIGASKVNAGTYVAFLVLMGTGILLACFLLPMDKVYKPDGTKVIAKKHPRIQDEIRGMLKVLVHEPKIYFMFPMFCASNFFYTYQFNEFNAVRFNVRTRSLNSLLYWLAQMVGSHGFGSDDGLEEILQTYPENVVDLELIDFKEGRYIGPMFLYMFYGAFDAIFQSFIFWVLGTLSNNPKKVALYASFYKSLQSAFAAIGWRLDALGTSYMAMFGASWGLVQGSLLLAAPLVLFMVTETTAAEDDGIDQILDESELRSVTSRAVEKV
ncbi:hypothetical protein JCM33374_g4104 [Metschnikowia sp. JCM 33374]|nr:hypothetical protein JCM33374_g4104 [Metschnikowia sp. JCM 33374]